MPAKPILLAEDDSNDVFMFWRFHKLCGIQNPLEVFSDGEDIITYFKSSRTTCPLPTVIFLDYKMPRMGGLEVLEYLSKSGFQGFSTIVLSGSEDFNLITKAQQLGAASCLNKPLEKQQFCELLGRTEGIEMAGCVDVPSASIGAAKSLPGMLLHPMHREILGRATFAHERI